MVSRGNIKYINGTLLLINENIRKSKIFFWKFPLLLGILFQIEFYIKADLQNKSVILLILILIIWIY